MKASLVEAFLGFIKMEKLNIKKKLFFGIVILSFGYALFSNFEYSSSVITNLFKKQNIERKVMLNNKKYGGAFNGVSYSFVFPDSADISIPNPAIKTIEFYKSNFDSTLSHYLRIEDNLELIVDRNHPEYQARQDTLRMLIQEYNKN